MPVLGMTQHIIYCLSLSGCDCWDWDGLGASQAPVTAEHIHACHSEKGRGDDWRGAQRQCACVLHSITWRPVNMWGQSLPCLFQTNRIPSIVWISAVSFEAVVCWISGQIYTGSIDMDGFICWELSIQTRQKFRWHCLDVLVCCVSLLPLIGMLVWAVFVLSWCS